MSLLKRHILSNFKHSRLTIQSLTFNCNFRCGIAKKSRTLPSYVENEKLRRLVDNLDCDNIASRKLGRFSVQCGKGHKIRIWTKIGQK